MKRARVRFLRGGGENAWEAVSWQKRGTLSDRNLGQKKKKGITGTGRGKAQVCDNGVLLDTGDCAVPCALNPKVGSSGGGRKTGKEKKVDNSLNAPADTHQEGRERKKKETSEGEKGKNSGSGKKKHDRLGRRPRRGKGKGGGRKGKWNHL